MLAIQVTQAEADGRWTMLKFLLICKPMSFSVPTNQRLQHLTYLCNMAHSDTSPQTFITLDSHCETDVSKPKKRCFCISIASATSSFRLT